MKLKDIKLYVENQLEVDLVTKNRKQRNIYAKAVYYELAYKYGRDNNGRKLSVNKIGSFINHDHSTVLHHRLNTVPHMLQTKPEFKRVYDNFSKIRESDCDSDIRDKYDVLMSDYVKLVSNYNNLEESKTSTNVQLNDLINSIDEDKTQIFIDRIKPMIKMINKAKFL